MARSEVCGRPEHSDRDPDLEDLREEYQETSKHRQGFAFEEAYCLSKIGRQPEDYDGPDRYCVKRTSAGRTDTCRVHKGERNLDPLASMKHSAYATSASVRKSFSEEEAATYEAIVDEWRAYYALEAPDKLHTLSEAAIEIIRLARIDEFLETREDGGLEIIRERFGPTGEVIHEPYAHHLLSEKRATLRQIEELKETIRDEAETVEVRGGSLDELRAGLNGALDDGPDESFAADALDRQEGGF